MKTSISILTLILPLAFMVASCSKDDKEPNTKDISGYAVVIADPETKTARIEIKQPGKWQLFAADAFAGTDGKSLLCEGQEPGTYTLDHEGYGLYSLLWSEGSQAFFAPWQLPVTGQPNFRDLGGYKTSDGRFVKWGLVFRSGDASKLTVQDVAYLATIPLKTVIDFRSEAERVDTDVLPETVTREISYPLDPGNLNIAEMAGYLFAGDIETIQAFMKDMNEKLVREAQEEYKAFFNELIQKNNLPLMFHCSRGKDRAGFASALFLSALGVDRETVIADYLLTNEMIGISPESMQEQYGSFGENFVKGIYYLESVQPEYIGQAFSIIDAEFGGVEAYLKINWM